jgi:UDP-N-acetylglucosamine diphosphorylase / glucose-1-phosphate thymidylyltransferase / UDP-N-acetylgalactosamine diphosphorylase / glucosamine-1-phosphate N-acetyltransferase / galactosamine-1-phosphate N-acetyltransferase
LVKNIVFRKLLELIDNYSFVEKNLLTMTKIPTVGIILAAGRGTRMNPLTLTTPKPLAKLNSGQTLLDLNLNRIYDLVDSFVIVTCYLEDKIKNYIGSSYKQKPVTYISALSPTTGTLDAFRCGVEASGKEANYIVTNADTVCSSEYYDILKDSIESDNSKCYFLATKEQDLEILKSLGVFVVDENNKYISVAEKSPIFVSDLANVGIYYFPSKVKPLIPARPIPQNSNNIPKEELITDLFEIYSKSYQIQILPCDGYSIAISTVDDLLNTNITD